MIPRWLTKYWGYVVLAILLSSLLRRWPELGPAELFTLSLAVVFYSLFQAPVWCGADNRDGTSCRRNAKGLLRGCSYRQHKWQKVSQMFKLSKWRDLNRGLWGDLKTGLATIATLLGIASTVVTLVKALTSSA